MINKLCGYAGCNCLSIPGKYFCSKHQALSDKRKLAHQKDFTSLKNASRCFNYKNPEWYRVKSNVLKNQPYCAYCGSRENLQVHHIKPVRYYPELVYEVSNLLVLCRSCHHLVTNREMNDRKNRRKG